MKNSRIFVMTTLIVCLGFSLLPLNTYAEKPTQDVNVVNTPNVNISNPLPVPVTGNVGISGTPNVNVANTPLPVMSNEPIRENFHIRADNLIGIHDVWVTFQYQVVIETLYVMCDETDVSILILTSFPVTATMNPITGTWQLSEDQYFFFRTSPFDVPNAPGHQLGPIAVTIPTPPSKKLRIQVLPDTASSTGFCDINLAYRYTK
jgi:hypothetical protein